MKFADATELRHLGQSLELCAVLRFVAQRPAQVLGDPGGVDGLRHYQHTPVRRVADQMRDVMKLLFEIIVVSSCPYAG